MAEAVEFPPGSEEQPAALNGEPVDRESARQLVGDCMLRLFTDNATGFRRLPVAGDSAEEAVQDAFVELYGETVERPELWMSTASDVADELLFTEWLARARRESNRWRRDFHRHRAGGLERLRIGADGPVGAESDADVPSPPPGLAWIEVEGLRWDAVVARFPALGDHDSPVWPTLLLRWCTGWDPYRIAGSLDGEVTAGEVFVRLVRLLRQHPREWMSLAGYCSKRHGVVELSGRRRRRDELDAVVGRNGWCDPFAPDIRQEGITLLVDWMTRTGRMPDPQERPAYEWPARAKRELVARRIATGFATHPRTYDRNRIWAPPENFASIAGHLTMQREISSDTARKYFERLRRDRANAWISDLLPEQGT